MTLTVGWRKAVATFLDIEVVLINNVSMKGHWGTQQFQPPFANGQKPERKEQCLPPKERLPLGRKVVLSVMLCATLDDGLFRGGLWLPVSSRKGKVRSALSNYIQKALNIIGKWCEQGNLSVNANKTTVLVCTKKKSRTKATSNQWGGVTICKRSQIPWGDVWPQAHGKPPYSKTPHKRPDSL